eukprot:1138389-Pelagomonas_calceolata.AAC.5
MLVAGRALPPHAHNRLSTPYLQEEQYHPPSWANPYIKLIPHSRLGLAQLSPSITEIVLPSIRCHCAFKRAFSWCILSLKFLHTQKWDGFTGARTLTYMADLTVRKGVSTMPQNDMFGNCFILPCWPRQSSEEEALNLYTGPPRGASPRVRLGKARGAYLADGLQGVYKGFTMGFTFGDPRFTPKWCKIA